MQRSIGVMVSPGRYVNLANSRALSHEQRVRLTIDRAIRKAKFKHHALRCENLIYEALQLAIDYRKNPHASYRCKKVTRTSFGTARPNTRNQEGIRMYWISALWSAWVLGTDEIPKVNNRRNPDTAFVNFVKEISSWFGLGNIVKNLERYQSYRRATLQGLDYLDWQKK